MKAGSRRTFAITAITGTVTKWPHRGCYIPVTRQWIGKDVYVMHDRILKFTVAGGKTGRAYVSVPCELAGKRLEVKLAT